MTKSKLAKNWRHINENGKSLPTLWERRISKTYSKLLKDLCFYYKNTKTNRTQWLDPTNCLNIYQNRSFSPTEKETSSSPETPDPATPTPTPGTPTPTPGTPTPTPATPTPTPAILDPPTPTPGTPTPGTPTPATPTLTPATPAILDPATPTPTPATPTPATPTPTPATPTPVTPSILDPATPVTPDPATPTETSVETLDLTNIPEHMNTQSFIEFLQTNGIEYNKQTKKWFDSNETLKLNSNALLYLNLFKYKSRVHDLLDILDNNDIVSSLLTHLKTEPGNIIKLIIKNRTTEKQGKEYIENRTTEKQRKEYIECLDVRKLNLEDITNKFQELNITEKVNLQYWDTSNFTSMKNMFSFKTKSQSISTMFDIKETNTTNKTMNINVTGLKYWNTSKVTDMNSMFRNNLTFNEELNWDTSQVIDMSNMFNTAINFNQPISTWDTSQVVDMSSMFKNATRFNQNVCMWDTSQVVDMSSMFNNATSFNQSIFSWDTRKVFDMRNMFNNATSFNQTIPWETKVIFDDDIITGSNAKLTFEYTLE